MGSLIGFILIDEVLYYGKELFLFCICFRLTKAEQEHHQKVVRAEIVTYPQNRIPSNPQSTVKTAVCSLQ